MGGGLQPQSLGIRDKCPPPTLPKFLSLVWDSEGAQKCFILHDQTTGDLKSHHLQAGAILTATSVLPMPPPWDGTDKVCQLVTNVVTIV